MRHHATPQLPETVRDQARRNFEILKSDPRHPSLHDKQIGRFRSARVGRRYRTLGVEVSDGVLWFWIGTHDEYDRLIGESAVAWDAGAAGKAPVMVSFSDLKWTEPPERKGMQFVVITGDPKKGEHTQVRKVPGGTDNPLHSHSSELTNVVIKGVWYTGADVESARNFGPVRS